MIVLFKQTSHESAATERESLHVIESQKHQQVCCDAVIGRWLRICIPIAINIIAMA